MFKQAGISLVETMVGLSIAAGISLVLMRQQETSNQMQAKTSADQSINSAVNIIQTSLANRAICTKSIENKGVGDSLTQIVDAKIDPTNFNNFIVTGVVTDTTTVLPGNIKIDSMEIIEKGPVGNRQDYLRVMFNRNVGDKKKVLGAKTIPKEFRLQGQKNGAGKYTLCYSEASNLVQTAVERACTSMGASWNSTTLKCELSNLPLCMLTSEPCRGRYPVNRGSQVLVTDTKKCTQQYKRESFVCGQKYFSRDCYCGGTSNPVCNCDTGRVGCYTRTSMTCAVVAPGLSVNNCCQN